MKSIKTRRQFLRNSTLVAASLSVMPSISMTKKSKIPTEDSNINCEKTTLDYYGEGPFYTDNPPDIIDNILEGVGQEGDRMIISGRVFNLECNEVIPDTIIDVWHANNAGQYDTQGFNFRGKTQTNAQGFYLFETIRPGKYLNGNQFRPSHIHFKITPPGFNTLTTQLYFEGDTSIPDDAAASIDEGQFDATNRIIPLVENNDKILEGTWDIVINGEGVVGTNDLHIDKGMIYSIFPNPSTSRVTIRYGVFKKARIGLYIYDMNGKTVATLDERVLDPEKYEAVWEPPASLPAGHYFIALRVNDLQVHYLKMIRQQ